MSRARVLLVGLCVVGICTLTSCETGSGGQPDEDSCGDPKTVCGAQTLHVDPDTGVSGFFTLTTPNARNDCEAQYNFSFRWADPLRRLTDTDMPPLEDLEHAFQPADEFAYFPHPNPVFLNLAPPGCYGPTDEPGWWVITFRIGNQNSGLPNTRYYVRARLDPTVATEFDDTEVMCKIEYFDKPKPP